jgi:hypothetical protein
VKRDIGREGMPRDLLDRFRDGKTIELPNLGSGGELTPKQQVAIERRVLDLIR